MPDLRELAVAVCGESCSDPDCGMCDDAAKRKRELFAAIDRAEGRRCGTCRFAVPRRCQNDKAKLKCDRQNEPPVAPFYTTAYKGVDSELIVLPDFCCSEWAARTDNDAPVSAGAGEG
jgi:hypothetical protein